MQLGSRGVWDITSPSNALWEDNTAMFIVYIIKGSGIRSSDVLSNKFELNSYGL